MESVKAKPMYRFLLMLTICSTMGLQAWRTLFDNFAVHVAGLDGQHVGIIQAVREIPGFLTLLAIYVMLVIKEHRLSAASIFILGLGVALTGLFPSFVGLMLTTAIMSFGYHYYETTRSSLTLQYFDKGTSPWVFGRLRSVAAASNIVIGVILFVMIRYFSYTNIYLMVGCVIGLAGIWGMRQDPTTKDMAPQVKKMIFRRKYWLYYLLTFLAGARRQIFVAFAVYLMVKKFNYTVQDITILYVINNTVNYFLSPAIGRAIIRYGERKVLSLEYSSLIFVFLAYTLVESRWLVGLLYVLDHIFFNFSVAISTYFQKNADRRDIAPSMAMGFTINHIASVALPVVGGLLWMIDYRLPFYIGAGLAVVSLLATQCIRIPDPEPAVGA